MRLSSYNVNQQLELSLYAGAYSHQEKTPLQTVLAYMKQFQEQTRAVKLIQAQLDETTKIISVNEDKLKQANALQQQLEQSNPNLKKANDVLVIKKALLEHSQKKTNLWRNKLIKPTLILAIGAVVTGIPLVLVLSGVLTFAIAPALFFTLLSIVPVFALTIGLGLVIAALVYAIKGAITGNEIKSHKKTMDANITQMDQNEMKLG